jgi:hypothetical protein
VTYPLPVPHPRDRIRVLDIRVERFPDGRIRFSTPMARGWAGVGNSPIQVTRALLAAFTEAAVAGYSAAHGHVYDLDTMTTTVPGDALAGGPQKRRRGPVERRAAHPPEAWAMQDDGTWRSPAGRTYQADSAMVAKVRANRIAKGLPVDTHGTEG